jgi:uncharacterized membrane protein
MGLALACGAIAIATRSRSRTLCATSGFTGAALLGFTAVDMLRTQRSRRSAPIEITRTTTIQRSADELYEYWRDLENLPRFFAHLVSVTPIDDARSLWIAKGPLDTRVEWSSEIVEDVPGVAIAWRSRPGSALEHEGRVRFEPAPGDRGTEVHVRLCWTPPVGQAIGKLLAVLPAHEIGTDLQRLKQILETGGVIHSDASIHRGLHPARPAAHEQGVLR